MCHSNFFRDIIFLIIFQAAQINKLIPDNLFNDGVKKFGRHGYLNKFWADS